MPPESYLFTSESVSEGHPDKVCDQISDAILDAYLRADPQARVACECLATTGRVIVAGEVRGPSSIKDEVDDIVRECVRDIGYEQEGFHWRDLTIENYLHAQSQDIARGVDAAENRSEGAGDQGMMFGFACDETDDFMPAPIHYAHRILWQLARSRKSGELPQLGPDAKCQLTFCYRNGQPDAVTSIVLSTQHLDPDMSSHQVRELVEPVVRQVLPEKLLGQPITWYVNPTGKFVIGGPDGDCGLTGRKIIVDTYGGAAPHGGGAFSGKDPTKVDRSAAYAARYLAKNVVAAGLAARCLIQISYAIGVEHPTSVNVETFGSETVSLEALEQAVNQAMDLTPRGIRERLKLNRPIYRRTASYGHFGRRPDADGGFSWEQTDLSRTLRGAV